LTIEAVLGTKTNCNTAYEGIFFTINGGNSEIVGFVPNANEAMLA